MTSTLYPDDFQNIGRLGSLKKLNRRRVGPTNPQIQEDAPFDVANTASSIENINAAPQTAMNQIPLQGTDVRANQVIDPQLEQALQKNQEIDWVRFGQSLAQAAGSPRNVVSESAPVISPESQLQEPRARDYPTSYAEFRQRQLGQNEAPQPVVQNEYPKSYEEFRQRQLGENIDLIKNQAEINEAQKQPYEISVYGNTDRFANSPELQQQFSTYTNIPWTKEIEAKEREYEGVMKSIEEKYDQMDLSLNEEQQRLKQRILNGQANDADKYYIGIALLLPAIAAGLFGAEAGLGALAGSAKGLGTALGSREERIRADEEALRKISNDRALMGLKRGELALEAAKIPSEIRKSMKNPSEDIEGAKIVTYTDPQTGEPVAQGVQLLPGLAVDPSVANTPEKRNELFKEAIKINKDEKPFLNRANAGTAAIAKIIPQIKDSKLLGKMIAAGLASDDKGVVQKLYKSMAPEVVVDGRKQNLAVFLDTNLELLKDAYRRNEKMRALTNTVSSHIENIASNPLYTGLTANDLLNQILTLRNRAQEVYADSIEGLGFLPQAALAEFGDQNRELFKGLNENEQRKEVEAAKNQFRKKR